MSDRSGTITTAIEHKADAVALSVVDGVPQFDFAANSTLDVEGESTTPTHCSAMGTADESIFALYEAQPEKYVISDWHGRQWKKALVEHEPPLRYLPDEM